MLKFSDSILFSTYLVPISNPKPDEWWYFGPDHGQHVSLYSRKSLDLLAKKFNKRLYSNGKNIHLITSKKISPVIIQTANDARYFKLFFISI